MVHTGCMQQENLSMLCVRHIISYQVLFFEILKAFEFNANLYLRGLRPASYQSGEICRKASSTAHPVVRTKTRKDL